MSYRKSIRWQRITLSSLFVGYAGYYLCRSNLSIATPLILDEFRDRGLTKVDIGTVGSIGLFFYAIGKVTNGLTADFVGGRILFLLGMFASAVCTLVFGLATGLWTFIVLWAVNRYVQSGGWAALVKVSSRWFPVERHGAAMGILCMSYLLGDAFSRLFLGELIKPEYGLGWRGMFFVAAASLLAIGVLVSFFLKSSPANVGCEEPAANPDNVFGAEGNAHRPEGFLQLILPLLRSPVFWLICFVNFGLTLIRETFNFWTPTFLYEVAGLSQATAAQYSLFVPLVGAISVFLAGHATDWLGGRHWRIIIPSLVLLVAALALLGMLPLGSRPVFSVCLISVISFFLIAPYSFLSGVMALDLGGKSGSSTTAGLIDSAGYFGAVVSGWGIGKIAENHGWNAAFLFLGGVAGITTIATIAYWCWHGYNSRNVH